MALFVAPLRAEILVLTGVVMGVTITAGLLARYTMFVSKPAETLEQPPVFERVIPCDCDCKCDGMPVPVSQEDASDEEGDSSSGSSSASSFHDSGHASPTVTEQLAEREPHSLETCLELLSEGRTAELRNGEIVQLISAGKLPLHAIERAVGDAARAVRIRRAVLSLMLMVEQQDDSSSQYRSHRALAGLPHRNYDFDAVAGRCAENVIGYTPVPVGIAGPLVVDGRRVMLPMATTEGALIASTSRGAKALNHALGGVGVQTELADDGMTRAPILSFPSLRSAAQAKRFLDSEPGQTLLADAFNASSRFARFVQATSTLVGSRLYVRFKARTGEAMGMNMVGKGVAIALEELRGATAQCPALGEMHVLSLSGNVCADKKAAAVNWIHGRGKSVCAEAVVPADAVRRVLKCEVEALVHVSTHKNLVGSAVAGSSVGGFNAQAANIVAAVFLATGQDIAQVVASSNCLTLMEVTSSGDLKASVTMPSLEVGTVGGGTALAPQSAMLELLGARDEGKADGTHAALLAKTIAAAVLAGELSLCSALVTQDLIKSHMALNRK